MTHPSGQPDVVESVRALDGTHIPEVNLNLNVRGLGLSATLAVNERSAQLRREGRRVYKLGLGQSPFPVPRCVRRRRLPPRHKVR